MYVSFPFSGVTFVSGRGRRSGDRGTLRGGDRVRCRDTVRHTFGERGS